MIVPHITRITRQEFAEQFGAMPHPEADAVAMCTPAGTPLITFLFIDEGVELGAPATEAELNYLNQLYSNS